MVERKVMNDEAKMGEAPPTPSLLPNDSVVVPVSDTSSAPGSPPAPAQKNVNLHPVIKIMQEKELGKTVIAFVVPISLAIVFVGNDKTAAPSEMNFILVLLCFGFVAIVQGILLKETFLTYALIAEAVGFALVVIAFFALVAIFLPAKMSWVPAVCIGLCLLPFVIAVLRWPPN